MALLSLISPISPKSKPCSSGGQSESDGFVARLHRRITNIYLNSISPCSGRLMPFSLLLTALVEIRDLRRHIRRTGFQNAIERRRIIRPVDTNHNLDAIHALLRVDRPERGLQAGPQDSRNDHCYLRLSLRRGQRRGNSARVHNQKRPHASKPVTSDRSPTPRGNLDLADLDFPAISGTT